MSVFCSHELILLVHLQTLSSHVTALAVDTNNTVLVSGDSHGMNIITQPIMLQEIITILQLYLYGYLYYHNVYFMWFMHLYLTYRIHQSMEHQDILYN